jgi:hypothetical protein
MKKILFVFLLFAQSLSGQQRQFDRACEVIKVIHNNNTLAVSEKVDNGDFILELYLFKLGLPSGYTEHKKSNDNSNELQKKVFKEGIPFNPTNSNFYSRKILEKQKYKTLVSFVKFDGRTLRVNVKTGIFKNPTVFPNISFYEYQFEFDQYSNLKQINWIEKKE